MDFRRLTVNLTTGLLVVAFTATAAQGADPITPPESESIAASEEKFPGPSDFVAIDTYPEATYRHAPDYPRLAQRLRLEGKVYVQTLVDTTGKVRQAIVGRSCGTPILDQAALDAALLYQYKPALRNGKPVACWVTYKVEFEVPKADVATGETEEP